MRAIHREGQSITLATQPKPVLSEISDSDLLKLRGFQLDRIEILSADFWLNELDEEKDTTLTGALPRAAKHFPAAGVRKGDNEIYEVVYARTLSADLLDLADAKKPFEGRTDYSWWRAYLPATTQWIKGGRRGETPGYFEGQEVLVVLWQLHHNRKLFFTESGYVGMCPKWALEGDIVCILLGGAVPFILQPEGDTFRLIGECYVNGVMVGEKMAYAQQAISSFVDFTLK